MKNQTKEQQRSTKTWVKVVTLVAIVFSTVALLGMYIVNSNLLEIIGLEKKQAADLEQDIQDLHGYINNTDTDDGNMDVAKGELGMVDPDTIIYEFD